MLSWQTPTRLALCRTTLRCDPTSFPAFLSRRHKSKTPVKAGHPEHHVSRPETIPLERWKSLGRQRRLRLWHIARIEEGGHGEPAAVPCTHCADNAKPCWLYKEEYRKSLGPTCSSCRKLHLPCSHMELPNPLSRTLRQDEEVLRLREEIVELKRQVEVLKKGKGDASVEPT